MYVYSLYLLRKVKTPVEGACPWETLGPPTFMRVSISLFLHCSFKVELEDLVQSCDPFFHFYFTISCQKITTFVLHFELKSKTPDFVVLKWEKGKETYLK